MEQLNYEVMGEFGIRGRRYFRKDNAAGIRTHHIHAFDVGSPELARHIAFRNFLRTHSEQARQYEKLKLELATRFPDDREQYTEGKSEFIRMIEGLRYEGGA